MKKKTKRTAAAKRKAVKRAGKRAAKKRVVKVVVKRAPRVHTAHVSPKLARNSEETSKKIADIFENGVLVDLNIGFWTAMNRNTARELGIKDERLPENIAGLGMKRLIEKELASGWKATAAHARYKLRIASYLFPVGQASFVPMKALPRLEEELTDLKEQFEKSSRHLGAHWDEIKSEMLKKYPKLTEASYPSRAEVMSMFYFDWTVYNVSLPRKAQLAQFNKKKAHADEQVLTRYKRELEERMTTFLAGAVSTLRQKTIDICVSIGQSINAGRIVTDRSLTTLRSHIDTFAEMNFIGDKEVEKRLDKLKREVLGERTREDFEQEPELQNALATALDEVRKAAEAVTDVGSIAGGYQRRIRV